MSSRDEEMRLILMRCGHVIRVWDDREPYCLTCGCDGVIREVPDTSEGLEGRTAKCTYKASCHNEVPSKWSLPFFRYLPDEEHDEYYCGCVGWD